VLEVASVVSAPSPFEVPSEPVQPASDKLVHNNPNLSVRLLLIDSIPLVPDGVG
jgi:hypothetical protein